MNTTAVNTLALMPTTESEGISFAKIILMELEQGQINPLEWARRIKEIKASLDLIENGLDGLVGLKELAINHASKYHKQDRVGFDVLKRTTYDYSNCCDKDWDECEERIKLIRERQENCEAFLKTINGSIEVVDAITGETRTYFEPQKKITEYLTFKK